MHTIGKLAEMSGTSCDTLRYYEKEGLLLPDSKSAAGYRLYGDQALQRMNFIRHAQQCGFSLQEIRDLLALRNDNDACCTDMRTVAIAKKLQLEHKIRALQLMSSALDELINACTAGDSPLDACPIVAALENSLAQHRRKGMRRA